MASPDRNGARAYPLEGRHPSTHQAWPRLTADQRRAVNEVWDETVVPVLEENARLRDELDRARLEAQDARDALRAAA